jgi:tRNA A37 threonylcarbamoyladenosine biosynthesis protein TsaE
LPAPSFAPAPGHDEIVPSPTFTLMQCIELPDLSIWHFDGYRS